MKLLVKIKKIFLTLLILIFSNSAYCEAKNWGGILPYAYLDGQAYLLVAFDSNSTKAVWGDFSCELWEDDDLYKTVSLVAHLGTRGVFANISDCIAKAETSEDGFIALNNGQVFFESRLTSAQIIDSKKEQQTNFTCVINHNDNNIDIYDYLFFVRVPFISAQNFINSFYSFQNSFFGQNRNEYLRRTGFAWIKIIDLINIINQRENLKMDQTRPIVFMMHQTGSNFIAKTSKLKAMFSGNKVVLNSYFSAELSSDVVLSIFKKIVTQPQGAFRSPTSSSSSSNSVF